MDDQQTFPEGTAVPPMHFTKADAKPPIDWDERRKAIHVRLKDAAIPDGMKRYIHMNALPDEEIDRLVSDWTAGKSVTHGQATWNQEPPAE